MSSTVFYVGGNEYATLTNVFTVNAVPTDPTAVTLTITDPQGVVTVWNYPTGTNVLTRLSAGSYQAQQAVAANDGLWNYVWVGTGLASDVAIGNWRVFPDSTNQWYTSLEEVKSRLGITDTNDDFEIQLAVQAAARWIEGRTGRFFYQMSDTRTYVSESIWECHIDDVVSVSALNTDPNGYGVFSVAWTQGVNFELGVGNYRYNQMSSGEKRPYRVIYVIGGGSLFFPFVWPLFRYDRIQVVGTFGWPAVPYAINQAALILATDLFKLKDAPFGIAGSAEMGMVRVGQGVSGQVEELIQPYIDSTRKVGV